MATRKVKDAKDLDTGELIYIKGHAKATYMSDGRTVEDAINAGGGGGGGGITVETDPVFSASPAASITEEKKAEWDSKYSKPSGGIPKSDLSAEVQGALRDALAYKGTVTQVKINDSVKSPNDGEIDLGTVVTPEDIEDVARLDEEYVVANGIVSNEDVYYHLPGINPDDTAHTLATKDDVSSAIETYVADFTMEELRQGADNGVDVECHMLFLIQAMNANKVILVRESDDQAYKGVCVLNGHAEDMLYFTIVDTNGEIIYCDGTDYHTARLIPGSSLHRRSFAEKQDALVSGTNIKTINGESILGSGDMVVGKITYFSEEDSIELSPNVVWMRRESVVNSLQITGFASNGKDSEEYAYHFYTGTIADGSAVKLILPEGVKYANKEIFDALESDTHYELSVVRSNGVVKAVLTAFK